MLPPRRGIPCQRKSSHSQAHALSCKLSKEFFNRLDPLTELGYGVVDFGTHIVPDPLNRHQFVYSKDEEISDDRDVVVSVLELPAAPPQPWIAPPLA